MPRHVVDLVAEALNERGKALRGARVGVLGVAFKPNVRDARNSPGGRGDQRARGPAARPSSTTIPTCRRSATPPARAHESAAIDDVLAADVVVVVTAHASIDLDAVYERAEPRGRHRQQLAGADRASPAGPAARRRLERRLSTNARGSDSRARDEADARPPAGRDARPRLLRRGSARAARGGVARRGRAGRSTSSGCAATATRRPASSTGSPSIASTSGATRAPACRPTSPSTWHSSSAHRGPSRRPTAVAATRSSRSTRRRTSWRSRRCRCGWSASRSCSTSTRRCRSSSDRASRGHRTRSSTRSCGSPSGSRSGSPTAAVTVNPAMRDRLVGPRRRGREGERRREQPLARPVRPVRASSRRAFAEDGTVRLVYAGALTPDVRGRRRDRRRRGAARRATGARASSFEVYGRGDAADPLAERARRTRRRRPRSRSTVASRSRTSRRRSHGPTSASPRRDATRSPTSASRRRSSNTPRWASRSWPRACRWSSTRSRSGPSSRTSPGDAGGMARAILAIVDDPLAREAAVERTAAIVAGNSWEQEAGRYVALVDSLARDTRPA